MERRKRKIRFFFFSSSFFFDYYFRSIVSCLSVGYWEMEREGKRRAPSYSTLLAMNPLWTRTQRAVPSRPSRAPVSPLSCSVSLFLFFFPSYLVFSPGASVGHNNNNKGPHARAEGTRENEREWQKDRREGSWISILHPVNHHGLYHRENSRGRERRERTVIKSIPKTPHDAHVHTYSTES